MESKIIPIPLSDPQFRDFFCSYLIEGKKICLVDVGPYNGHAELIKRLEKLNVERIDYILLTHIHIDHAGALQPLLDAYPMARGVCHEMGIKFLANPDSFWDASLKVLKERAIQYGKPAPVSAERLDSHKEASIPGVRILTTPGHAPHHLCFLTDSEIFLGEAGGNHFYVNGRDYLRPATPHRFFLDQAIKSIDLLMETRVDKLCYAHCGKAEDGQRLLRDFRDQLKFWYDSILEFYKNGDSLELIMDKLLSKDIRLKEFKNMNSDEQIRELEFLRNSVLGFLGFIKERDK